jgi:hypothetical protein
MTRSDFKVALEDILSVPRGSLKDTDTRDTVPGWSSIVDVQILAYVAGETGLEADVQLLSAESVGDLMQVVESSLGT